VAIAGGNLLAELRDSVVREMDGAAVQTRVKPDVLSSSQHALCAPRLRVCAAWSLEQIPYGPIRGSGLPRGGAMNGDCPLRQCPHSFSRMRLVVGVIAAVSCVLLAGCGSTTEAPIESVAEVAPVSYDGASPTQQDNDTDMCLPAYPQKIDHDRAGAEMESVRVYKTESNRLHAVYSFGSVRAVDPKTGEVELASLGQMDHMVFNVWISSTSKWVSNKDMHAQVVWDHGAVVSSSVNGQDWDGSGVGAVTVTGDDAADVTFEVPIGVSAQYVSAWNASVVVGDGNLTRCPTIDDGTVDGSVETTFPYH